MPQRGYRFEKIGLHLDAGRLSERIMQEIDNVFLGWRDGAEPVGLRFFTFV